MGAVTEKMMITSDSDSDIDVEFFFPLEMMFENLSWLTGASLLRCFQVEEEAPRARIEKKMNASDRNNNEVFFPIEIMFEIFSRLKVVSLMRFKYVCKQWNEIIQHPKFIQMHMLCSRKGSVKYYNTSKDEDVETFTVLHSRCGLLVEKNKISRMYRVRNPATKQTLALPQPKDEVIFMVIVFIPSTGSYKLVYIYENEGETGKVIGFKVLNFEGSDLSWRNIDNSYAGRFNRVKNRIDLDFDGAFLYCIVLYDDGSCESEIFCLDVETEILRGSPIIVPRSFFGKGEKVQLGNWDDNLAALMNIVDYDLHVWVLEDPIKGKWAEQKIVIPLTFLKENPDMKERFLPYWASHKRIWFRKDDNIFTYNIRSKQAWKLEYSVPRGKTMMCDRSFNLVTLKGMQPEKKQNYSKDKLEEIQAKFVKLGNQFIVLVSKLCD